MSRQHELDRLFDDGRDHVPEGGGTREVELERIITELEAGPAAVRNQLEGLVRNTLASTVGPDVDDVLDIAAGCHARLCALEDAVVDLARWLRER